VDARCAGKSVSDRILMRVDGLEGGYSPASTAISAIHFSVNAGEIVAVLGPNGGGKTTLFRALLGELPQQRGTIELAGGVAYVPQTERARLDYPVSALDVALMGTYATVPWYRRVGRDERDRAAAALVRVGLSGNGDEPFGALSGGQRQRVLIARALAQETAILLLDEPLSGVDAPSAERVLSVLGELRREGRAVLVATHDIAQARRFDRVLCLNRAQVAFGTPAETLLPATLQATYGSELIVLDGGERAVVVSHHEH
jgi:manganese/iron transport system ATP-binding protein/manganese/zinc/iron transport system ATP- binding protein